MFPEDLRYSESHEWVRLEGGLGVIGITYYAQEQLGDVVHVELPPVDTSLKKGDIFGTIESVKASSDLYAPVSGTVVEVNGDLSEEPERINQDPYGKGWMIVVEMEYPEELDHLLTASAYEKLVSG